MARQVPGKARKSPRQSRSRATVDAILVAAAHLLRTLGRERTTTNRIAKVAGVSVGSVYQYFPNKEAIWDELRSRHDHFFESEVRDGIDEVHEWSFREAVEAMIERMVAVHALDGPLHQEIYRAEDPYDGDREREYRGHLQAFFEENACRLRPIGDPELAAFVMVRALTELVHGVALREPERLRHPDYARELTELLVRYCGAPEGS